MAYIFKWQRVKKQSNPKMILDLYRSQSSNTGRWKPKEKWIYLKKLLKSTRNVKSLSHQIVEVCLYFSSPFFTVVIILRNNLNEVGSTWERELDPCTFSCIFMTDLWFYRKAVCNAVWLMTMIMQQMCHGVSLSLSLFSSWSNARQRRHSIGHQKNTCNFRRLS